MCVIRGLGCRVVALTFDQPIAARGSAQVEDEPIALALHGRADSGAAILEQGEQQGGLDAARPGRVSDLELQGHAFDLKRTVGVEIGGAKLGAYNDGSMPDFFAVRSGGREIGRVTSACYSPRLDRNIGYAMVPIEHAEQPLAAG